MKARTTGIAPWAGLIAAAAGWALHHQIVTEALHFDCNATVDGVGIAVGIAALALVLGGALVSWRALPAAGEKSSLAALRRFAVQLSMMAALLAALGIGFNILAGALLPGCRP